MVLRRTKLTDSKDTKQGTISVLKNHTSVGTGHYKHNLGIANHSDYVVNIT